MLGELKRDVAELEQAARRSPRASLTSPPRRPDSALIDAEMSRPASGTTPARRRPSCRSAPSWPAPSPPSRSWPASAEETRLLWEMATEAGDESVTAEIQEGLKRLREELEAFELKIILSGPQDRKNAILSIHPGAGGTESQDWAQMLMRMYLRWAERRGFKAEVVDLLPGEEAGIKSRHHRDHGRVRLRLSQGRDRRAPADPHLAVRRLASAGTPRSPRCAVIPEVEDVEVVVQRRGAPRGRLPLLGAGRPGGEHRGLRGPHHPPADAASWWRARTSARSSANRDTAMRILKSRLYQIYEKKQQAGAGRADRREEGHRLRQPDPHLHASTPTRSSRTTGPASRSATWTR